MSAQPETYAYDRDFQEMILALMVREPQTLPVYRDVIDPRYFADPEHRTVARLILTLYDDRHHVPTWTETRACIVDHCVKLRIEPDDLLAVIHRLEVIDDIDPDFVLTRVCRFGQRQEMKISLHKIIDMLDTDEEFDNARTLVEKALAVGASRRDGLELFDAVGRIEEIVQDSPYSGSKVPTGVPALDAALGGGVGGPQFGVIQAPPKTGKSTMMTSFGAAACVHLAQSALEENKNVLHVSFELYEEDVLLMYLARFTGLTRGECSRDFGNLRACWEKVNQFLAPGQLRIQYFNPFTLTPGGLRDYLGRLRAVYGWTPRTMILDYADRMKIKGDDAYREYGKLYDELIALGNDFGYNTWTGTQANRGGYQAEKGTANQASDSWLKVANADMWIPLSQTYQERMAHMARMNVEFLRRGADGFEVPLTIDYARSTVKQSGDPSFA
jgi:hypothetical protein